MAVPAIVNLMSDFEAFAYAMLLHLIRARDLRLISIWSPTYLLLMLDRLTDFEERMSRDLEECAHGRADYRHGRELREALRADSPQETYARLWPKLSLISCWKDANAAGPAANLAALFPRCQMQGKGLIATEAFISFPLTGQEAAALSVRSHFFEFLPSDSDRPQIAHQLDRGGLYSVAVTNGGGLYRYLLGDQIQVTGHMRDCPLVRFAGRQGNLSDWFGEKLNEAHVSQVLNDVFGKLGLLPSFAMLACDTASPPGYVLYIDVEGNNDLLARVAEAIDKSLRESFHYVYARRLEQLASVRAVLVRDGARLYVNDAVQNGQKLGDVKVPALDRRGGWSSIFGAKIKTAACYDMRNSCGRSTA
jgi:hypothetical protein